MVLPISAESVLVVILIAVMSVVGWILCWQLGTILFKRITDYLYDGW